MSTSSSPAKPRPLRLTGVSSVRAPVGKSSRADLTSTLLVTGTSSVFGEDAADERPRTEKAVLAGLIGRLDAAARARIVKGEAPFAAAAGGTGEGDDGGALRIDMADDMRDKRDARPFVSPLAGTAEGTLSGDGRERLASCPSSALDISETGVRDSPERSEAGALLTGVGTATGASGSSSRARLVWAFAAAKFRIDSDTGGPLTAFEDPALDTCGVDDVAAAGDSLGFVCNSSLPRDEPV